MTKRERDYVQTPTLRFAKKNGILALQRTPLGNTGWPDDEFFHKGYVVFIEFKAPGDDLERNQPERINTLVDLGFTVGVFDASRAAISFLEATLLSEAWRETYGVAGVCWIALQARARKDKRCLHGDAYLAGQTVRPAGSGGLPAPSRLQRLA